MNQLAVAESSKIIGSYYTPAPAVTSLVRWVVRAATDRLLDPSCGDGRFLREHGFSVGVEREQVAAEAARQNAPLSRIECSDFFSWAERTTDRFECAAGNPPFIRYQHFAGPTRSRALRLCREASVDVSGLTSSWVPFLIVSATLLKPGGRMGFVVPAEISYSSYARPLVRFLLRKFSRVQLIAVKRKLFPELLEDCWLLYAEGFGGSSKILRMTKVNRFHESPTPPSGFEEISESELEQWNFRLRAFLLDPSTRRTYVGLREMSVPLGRIAKVGIGYVTGANDFFHFRPSETDALGIPEELLIPSVRSSRYLASGVVNRRSLQVWRRNDEPFLLLRIPADFKPRGLLQRFLSSDAAHEVSKGYKCRNRSPWWHVPDVRVPDAFLSYMSGTEPRLILNEARCTCTNALHYVRFLDRQWRRRAVEGWQSSLTRLSCEVEGHSLGGGVLKLEPREAGQVLLPEGAIAHEVEVVLRQGLREMRAWRKGGTLED